MGFFDRFRQPDIDRGVEDYRAVPGAVLLDVRTPEEYREGHIPGSMNLPLQTIERAAELIRGNDTPIFVYCRSGARSGQAAAALRDMGYANVRNIGGIIDYSGRTEQ